jgi:hypothetical protein
MDPLDLQLGLVQGAIDEKIQVFGRKDRGFSSSLKYLDPLVPISPEYFHDHEILFLGADDNRDTKTTNVRDLKNVAAVYADLRVRRRSAIRWLATDANQFRGATERAQHRKSDDYLDRLPKKAATTYSLISDCRMRRRTS